MNRLLLLSAVAIVGLAGCTASIPYRDGSYAGDRSCRQKYDDYDAAVLARRSPPPIELTEPCWARSKEEHEHYDLLFVEFDDQGWMQGALNQRRPGDKDHLDMLFEDLERTYRRLGAEGQGISLVVFVHGWHHNADVMDQNVHAFRRLLREIAISEDNPVSGGQKMRVVGLYIGWRGESVTIPLLSELTFWERKNTAERVAQGAVQELLQWLDLFRDRRRDSKNRRNVRMLTIGHSFGGLVAFEAMSGEFLRNTVRFKGNEAKPSDAFVSRLGDLVVIVNPAFEGARYEPLRAASLRMRGLERNQLPVLVVATSRADWATGIAFPLARIFNTALESQPGEEWTATVKAVGHNTRYITHELELCEAGDQSCRETCGAPPAAPRGSGEDKLKALADLEYAHMSRLARDGIAGGKGSPYRQYLCGGMELRSTGQHYPDHNPFWVIRTTKDVMRDHGDIFNPNFVAFVRQMYLGVIAARRQAKD